MYFASFANNLPHALDVLYVLIVEFQIKVKFKLPFKSFTEFSFEFWIWDRLLLAWLNRYLGNQTYFHFITVGSVTFFQNLQQFCFIIFSQEINIEFGNEKSATTEARREVPVWITESTVTTTTSNENQEIGWSDAAGRVETPEISESVEASGPDNEDEITSLLLRHEKRSGSQKTTAAVAQNNDSDSDNK